MNVTVWKCAVEPNRGIEPEEWEVHGTYYCRSTSGLVKEDHKAHVQSVVWELLRDGYMIRIAPWGA